ncbi:MAG: aspartyl/asparaginyl beta-hydroxylase domain-containing protein [Solirubrobacteraceae bacterium]
MSDVVDAVDAFLHAEGAERMAHAGGRTLLDHLRGTAAIVDRWGQPDWLRRAALIHSVYGTDAYHPRLIDPARRDELAAVAGERAERLAYLFCVTPRRPLFAGTHRWARDLPLRRLSGGADTDVVEPATRAELDALVLVHMANLADQARAADGSPARWLVRLRDLGELVIDTAAVAPPPCVGALSDLGAEDESLALRTYAQAAGDAGGGEGRTDALALAATACPVIAEPCVWLAHLARCRGDDASARAWAAHAHARLQSLGTPWDKRLTFEDWLAVIDALEHPLDTTPSREAAAITEPRALLEAVTGTEETRASRDGRAGRRATAWVPVADEEAGRRRFQRYVEGLGGGEGTAPGPLYPDLPSRPWHDPRDVPLAGYLEAHFSSIRAEILALDGARFQPESERIGRTGDWDVVFLYERGRRHDDVCAACPVTADGVDAHRTVRTAAGLIYVSRLRAGTHISAHRGPTNLRLRCHLGITVPRGDCAIRVGERTERWQEGRCLVFDDSFDHEAWNDTDEDRIVLIVDLWHPALSDAEVSLLEGLHAHTYRHARRLSRYWAANAAAARA